MFSGCVNVVILVVPILICVAFMTLAERKVLSLIGTRQGPNKVSFQGILQPMADAMKLANKATNSLTNFSMSLYYLSVIIMLSCSLLVWSVMAFMDSCVNWKFSMLVLMLVLGVASMKAIMAGWSTYGKYSLIGSMRTVSQMISYESVLYLCLLSLIWFLKNFSLVEIGAQKMNAMLLTFPIVVMFWLPSMMAELNRTPYDFSEGESELVSGFNTEFGSSSFTLIFLSEYSNILFFVGFSCIAYAYLESSAMILGFFLLLNIWIIWVRSALPRMRFDKFMMNSWKFYIPFMTIFALLIMAEI